MNITELIDKKKRGRFLSENEIRWIIKAYTDENINDYHMSALAMAIYFQGMNDEELSALTFAMAESGETIDLSCFGDFSVDKHSTGGVGDKTTLIITPIVACLGAKVAKMSGRGLGHTGGTIDKLQAIPGYNTSLSGDDFIKAVSETGVSVIGANKQLAPADKKLYALRDVTATVDSIPLIASSIMSKKLASGAKNIVIDVKFGSGAFMKTLEDAAALAEKIVAIGKGCNRRITAVITDMDSPLGCAVGNALEVREAIDVLMGKGPADLREICVVLASEMLSLVFGGDWRERVEEAIDSGEAYNKFCQWIKYQGGDINKMPEEAGCVHDIVSESKGYITAIDSEGIGKAAMVLGAGRSKVTDVIDPAAGIILQKKLGDPIEPGELLATLYTNDPLKLSEAISIMNASYTFDVNEPVERILIHNIIR